MKMENPTTCECGKPHWVKGGIRVSRAGKRQRWQCANCGRVMLGAMLSKAGDAK
jgi:transposase-like protein